MSFVKNTFNAVVAELPSIRHLYGEREHERVDSPPRIVWRAEEAAGSYRPAREVGGRPRVLWTRVHPVEIHLWARDDDELELLEQAELAALHHAARGNYEVVSFAPYEDNEANLAFGIGRVITVHILVPIVETDSRTMARLLEITHQTEMEFDASTELCGHTR